MALKPSFYRHLEGLLGSNLIKELAGLIKFGLYKLPSAVSTVLLKILVQNLSKKPGSSFSACSCSKASLRGFGCQCVITLDLSLYQDGFTTNNRNLTQMASTIRTFINLHNKTSKVVALLLQVCLGSFLSLHQFCPQASTSQGCS